MFDTFTTKTTVEAHVFVSYRKYVSFFSPRAFLHLLQKKKTREQSSGNQNICRF